MSSDNHHNDLAQVVRSYFPLLGYSREEVDRFLDDEKANKPDPSDLCRLETAAGSALARIEKGLVWDISYLIPADWDRRFEILEEAIENIISRARREKASEVFLRIEENPPSHTAYFAGMLPRLGFTLTPRAGLTAPLDTVKQLTLSELPGHIEECTVEESDLAAMVEWYGDALLSHRKRPISEEERRTGDEGMLEGFKRYLRGDNSCAWVVLADGSQKVGLAIGTCNESGNLTLSQVGVASTHRGYGLGKYVIVRCMQRLTELYGDKGRRFFVRTGRTWRPAYGLYQNLGFRPSELYTYAQWFPD